METVLLSALLLCAFVLPILSRKIEDNLEIFLFVCGVCAVSISHLWSRHLVMDALQEPLKISLVVLFVGLMFKQYHFYIDKIVRRSVRTVGLRWTMFLVVATLGLLSSLITAIVAAMILSEVAAVLSIGRRERIKLIICTCFAISVGAILTPVGEPLGTIVMSKLAGPPHYADTAYVFKLLWPYIISGTIILGFLAFTISKEENGERRPETDVESPDTDEIMERTGKVYLFVAALVFLGAGLEPLAYKTIYKLSHAPLYWVNVISAMLDNATLAAVEIVPDMTEKTLKFLLVSLIMGGGMLIPGNIPNIICSSKLKIKSKEWAFIAVPLGLALMLFYFIIMMIFVR